jgi:hypothetical protein
MIEVRQVDVDQNVRDSQWVTGILTRRWFEARQV